MFAIATSHPIGLRTFATRGQARAWATAYQLGAWRVYLNLRKDR